MLEPTGTVIQMPLSELLRVLSDAIAPVTAQLSDINNRLTRIEANVTGENGRLPRIEEIIKEHDIQLKILEAEKHSPSNCPLKDTVRTQETTVNWLKWLAVGLLAVGGMFGWEIHILLTWYGPK